jgi:glycosyltransferase involved in cell wall biosynthesis
MRILHVDSAAAWRGGQNQALLAARGMAARGHAVTLACRAGGVLAERARAAGLDVRAVPFGGDLDPRAALVLARVARDVRPEVAQLHDPHALAAGWLASLLLTRVRRPRRVATRRVDFRLRGAFSRAKYRACERVIAVSRAIARVLADDGLPAPLVRLVYEGVPDRRPQPGGRDALGELGLPAGAPVVGNVAALTDHKDHATLLRAAALVLARRPDARFVIVGEGELRAALEARARALGIAERVVFAGFRQDLDRLLPAFDVFCLSSHLEGLGTSLLDAMCFGRPVVATAAGGIPEAVEDGVSGRLVAVRDAPALAQALLDVLGDPTRAAAYGAAGRRRFEQRFTAERMVDESLKVYAELLAEERP